MIEGIRVPSSPRGFDIREPLLWKGDDFGHMGIASALTR
jgi:hypothetical protein